MAAGVAKMVKRLTPLFDRVLITKVKPVTSIGDIILPPPVQGSDKSHQEGKVVAIGKGKRGLDGKLLPMSLKIGDTVLVSKYGGNEVKLNDQEYILCKEEDVLGIVETTNNDDLPNLNELKAK